MYKEVGMLPSPAATRTVSSDAPRALCACLCLHKIKDSGTSQWFCLHYKIGLGMDTCTMPGGNLGRPIVHVIAPFYANGLLFTALTDTADNHGILSNTLGCQTMQVLSDLTSIVAAQATVKMPTTTYSLEVLAPIHHKTLKQH